MTALTPTTLCALDRAVEAYLFHCWFERPMQQDIKAQHNTTTVLTYFVVTVVLQVSSFPLPSLRLIDATVVAYIFVPLACCAGVHRT